MPQLVVCAGGHAPFPSQLVAALVMPFMQPAARHCVMLPGYAHAAPLGEEENPRMPPTLVQDLEGSVKK